MNIKNQLDSHNISDINNNNNVNSSFNNYKPKDRRPIDVSKSGLFYGDNLIIKMEVNHRQLEIIGDGCQVTIINNHAKIKIIGDGGVLRIIGDNFGDLVYYGDGGKILLGENNNLKKVQYVGDGGQVNNKKFINGLELSVISGGFQKISGIGIKTTKKLKPPVVKMTTPD
ncbi:uncharacterized protein LOC141531665 [Cotesia typhae]|uniref:uncharacterized protein LOC141531665 n=1 Tax=Cotesia typhae TaxID=2053667 RepID=UPI003D69B182